MAQLGPRMNSRRRDKLAHTNNAEIGPYAKERDLAEALISIKPGDEFIP
jgi:hypothetical protein